MMEASSAAVSLPWTCAQSFATTFRATRSTTSLSRTFRVMIFSTSRSYPEGRFVITSTESVRQATPGAPNLKLQGELTLKNVTLPVEFLATAGMTPEGKSAAQASFAIDRTLWEVLYGSGKYFRNLGGHLVNDLIELQLRIVTR